MNAVRAHSGGGLLDSSHGLVDAVDKLVDVLKVPGHLGGQHHVYDGLPQGPELGPAPRGDTPHQGQHTCTALTDTHTHTHSLTTNAYAHVLCCT